MKSYSKLYSDFWVNYDNFEVMSLSVDCRLMALYLQSNSHHNMFGVYYLPLLYIASDLRLPVEQVHVALKKLCEINYCKYDKCTQYIWVCNIAYEQIGETIDTKDNRIKAIHTIWQSLPSRLEFLEEIYQKYKTAFHLKQRSFEKPLNQTGCIIKKTEEVKKNAEIKDEMAVAEMSSNVNTNTDTNVIMITSENTDTVTNSIASINANIQLPLFVSPVKETFNTLQSQSTSEKGLLAINSNLSDAFEGSFDAIVCPVAHNIPQKPLEITRNKEESVNSSVSLKKLQITFGGASKYLPDSFRTPLRLLRSNIEDRSKNIEYRNKSEQVEEKKKRDINYSNVLFPNIVAQARPCPDLMSHSVDNFLFLKGPEELVTKSDAIEANGIVRKYYSDDFCNLSAFRINLNSRLEPTLELRAKQQSILKLALDSQLKSKAITSKISSDEAISTVFEHWKKIMQHPKSNFDRKRKVLISKALRLGYSTQQLCDAITGCSHTPHNIGQNDRGQRYDGLHIILRDADQIDRFIHNYHNPPEPYTEANHRLRSNIYEADKWVKEKRNESVDVRMGRYV